jgi:isoleucyl-tRNA synthetase
MYKELSKKPNKEREHEISEYWKSIDLLHQSVDSRDKGKKFVFYDGPPTANGMPGLHHVISRGLKDAICRFKTMQGYHVKRKAGWDTHGLPVEIEVEKKLNLSNKQDIEAYGIEAFNKQCRESVFVYEEAWRKQTERMAYLVDLDDPYVTLENNYIESVWWILNKFFKEDFIYEGHKILPYCSRCGTGLATHEVALGYQEITTDTVYVKFKRKDKNEYFLVWTTTPWTLASNVALTVRPDAIYQRVVQDDTTYIIEKTLAKQVLGDHYEVIDEMDGKSLEYVEYEQLMPFVKVNKKAFFVTCADYVTTDDGTGIVHTAPAFGEDDYKTGRNYDLPVPQPVDADGLYTETPWAGTFVIDADPKIIIWLKENGLLYRKQKMEHNYPHCWRCKTPLLYSAKPSWYIEITKIKDQLIANNNEVNWHPDYVGEKRFGNWLENLNDWAISRSRYWGTPLNIWRCECGHTDTVGSIAELVERSIEPIDDTIELHRPYVDNVHLKCDKCGGTMTRVPEVVDVWFDSGAMPFAQYHYPFENKENFDELFPADYICEGIDQTRGWFYSLLAVSTFVTGKSPYKNVLVNDLLLDREGKKMSKSKGNTVDSFELFDRYGADAVRWYLNHVSPAWTPTKFDEDGLKEVKSKFFRTLENVYNFFTLYANIDGIKATDFNVPKAERPELDRWILSKLNTVVKGVTDDLDNYDLTKAVRKMQDFVNEDLSNWYIRRSRRRFWNAELDIDKKSVYNTTYEVLVAIVQLAAPIVPYISEEIYRNLVGGDSVHLSNYPTCDEVMIDPELERKMDLSRTLVALGRAARESVKIKVRQPIQKIFLDGRNEAILSDLSGLIKEELNVKDIEFIADVKEYMNFTLKPNFRALGPILGKDMGAFGKAVNQLDPTEVVKAFDNGEKVAVKINDERTVEVDADQLVVNIISKEGFTVQMEGNDFIILDTHLNDELIQEGYAREFVSRVQQMRKSNGFDVSDHIKIYFTSTGDFTAAITKFSQYVMDETLAVTIEGLGDKTGETHNLNGHETSIYLERIV